MARPDDSGRAQVAGPEGIAAAAPRSQGVVEPEAPAPAPGACERSSDGRPAALAAASLPASQPRRGLSGNLPVAATSTAHDDAGEFVDAVHREQRPFRAESAGALIGQRQWSVDAALGATCTRTAVPLRCVGALRTGSHGQSDGRIRCRRGSRGGRRHDLDRSRHRPEHGAFRSHALQGGRHSGDPLPTAGEGDSGRHAANLVQDAGRESGLLADGDEAFEAARADVRGEHHEGLLGQFAEAGA